MLRCPAEAAGREPPAGRDKSERFGRLADLQALISPMEIFLDGLGFTDREHGVRSCSRRRYDAT